MSFKLYRNERKIFSGLLPNPVEAIAMFLLMLRHTRNYT